MIIDVLRYYWKILEHRILSCCKAESIQRSTKKITDPEDDDPRAVILDPSLFCY